MRRRWRIWRGNPNASVRLGLVAVLGAFIAGALSGGNSSLYNVIALLFVVASAWYEGHYADAVSTFLPAAVRRGALIRFGAGALVLASAWLMPDGFERFSTAALFGGLALVSGASARLAMSDGARYAARKLQERLDDDL
jgi:hypothetical protein